MNEETIQTITDFEAQRAYNQVQFVISTYSKFQYLLDFHLRKNVKILKEVLNKSITEHFLLQKNRLFSFDLLHFFNCLPRILINFPPQVSMQQKVKRKNN